MDAGDEFDVLGGVEIIIDTIKEEHSSERLLWKICGKVIDIFHCDRAWLLFPCDPASPSWSVPIERAVPEFPGASVRGELIDMTSDVAGIFQEALQSQRPVVYGPGGLPLAENTKGFNVKSQLSMAIFPRVGKPWQFGIHQCSYARSWSVEEIRLFQIIGIMTAEALGNILLVRDLQESNETLEQRVTERTAELRAEKEFAESLIETAQAIVLLLDADGRIVRFNRYMEEISGCPLVDVAGRDWFDTFLPEGDRSRVTRVFESVLHGAHAEGLINPILARDGQERIIEWYAKALQDPDENLVGVLAVGHDITERVQIEAKVRAALEEKEVLLREIHHRVKNNMQVVSSLLGIQISQMDNAKDPALQDAFRETASRINSMALVHERLYRSADFAHIDFRSYIKKLAEDLFHVYEVQNHAIELDTRIQDVRININQAIPGGLIVNELLSNALKHGFPGGRSGRIIVVLRSDEDGKYELSVCDDGVGLPGDFDLQKAQTTGMVVVKALVRQLGANMIIDRGNGACFQISFRGG